MALTVVRIAVRKARVRAEVARSPLALGLGLMFRRQLTPGRGLLLEFPSAARRSLHMWGVRFPLDVLFLDDRRRVVEVAGARPWQLPFRSRRPVRYALEVGAGWCRRNGIRPGDRARWSAARG